MMRLGLIGYSLDHSLSPVLHQAALRRAGLQGKYALHPVRPDDAASLRELIRRMRQGEIDGLNVTIPHKQAVVPLLDQLTPAAQAIGAVNTIYLREGRVVGDNTDFAGFLADLLRWTRVPRTAIVLGAGGAARAVVYALGTMGCQVSVAARRADAAAKLCRGFAHASPVELRPEALHARRADLLVNATPAGMFPEVEAGPWPDGLLPPAEAAVYDLVYNPPETPLMRQARAAGLRATNGLGMLIEQAGLSFELWTGCRASKESMMEAIGQAAR